MNSPLLSTILSEMSSPPSRRARTACAVGSAGTRHVIRRSSGAISPVSRSGNVLPPSRERISSLSSTPGPAGPRKTVSRLPARTGLEAEGPESGAAPAADGTAARTTTSLTARRRRLTPPSLWSHYPSWGTALQRAAADRPIPGPRSRIAEREEASVVRAAAGRCRPVVDDAIRKEVIGPRAQDNPNDSV